MRNCLTLILLFIATIVMAQTSWIVDIPELGSPKKMIETNDHAYALFADAGDDFVYYKYDDHGNLLQSNALDISTELHSFDVIQLSNGNYVLSGLYYRSSTSSSGTSLHIISESGDSVRYIDMGSDVSESIVGYVNLMQATDQEFWAVGMDGNNYFLYRYDLDGFLVGVETNDTLNYSTQHLKIEDNLILRSRYVENTDESLELSLRDSNLNVISSATYCGVDHSIVRQTVEQGIVIHDNWRTSGLYRFSNTLDSLWFVPFDDYAIESDGGDYAYPNDMIVCSDGGYAMCGTNNPVFSVYSAYLLKTDYYGNMVFSQCCINSWTNNNKPVSLLQTQDDGFLMFVGDVDGIGGMTLIKTKPDGTIGIEESSIDDNMGTFIFPNPASHILNVNTSEEDFSIEVCDVNGQLLLQVESSTSIDVRDLTPGIYILRWFGQDRSFTQKLVIQR